MSIESTTLRSTFHAISVADNAAKRSYSRERVDALVASIIEDGVTSDERAAVRGVLSEATTRVEAANVEHIALYKAHAPQAELDKVRRTFNVAAGEEFYAKATLVALNRVELASAIDAAVERDSGKPYFEGNDSAATAIIKSLAADGIQDDEVDAAYDEDGKRSAARLAYLDRNGNDNIALERAARLSENVLRGVNELRHSERVVEFYKNGGPRP